MVRPASKILSDKNAPDTSASDADVKTPATKPVKAEKPKVDVKARTSELKAALAKSREPLNEREAKQKEADKALAAFDKQVVTDEKARAKALNALTKEHNVQAAAAAKARKALVKTAEGAKFSVDKAREAFAKGEAKITGQIEALKA